MRPFWRAFVFVARLLVGLASILAFVGWYWGLRAAQRDQFWGWLWAPVTSMSTGSRVLGAWVLLAASLSILALLMFRPLLYLWTVTLAAITHQAPVDYASSFAEVGLTRSRQGRFWSAEAYFRLALAMKEAVRGSAHKGTANTVANLGKVMQRQGRHRSAVRMYRRALTTKEAACGPRDSSLVPTLVSLAFTLYSLGEYEEAEETATRALDIARGSQQEQLIARTTHQFARILMLRGKLGEAHSAFRRAVNMRIKLNGPGSHKTASSQYRWGQNYRLRGQYGEALRLQLAAAKVLRKAGSPQEFSHCLGEIAKTLRDAGRFRMAVLIARYRLAFALRSFAATSPELQVCQQALVEVLRALSTPDALREAEELARQSARIPGIRRRLAVELEAE